jgi:uncharacterized protein DUF1844
MSEPKESGFKVTDRRKFNADGSPRDAGATEPTWTAVDNEATAPLGEEAAESKADVPPAEAATPQPESPPPAADANAREAESSARRDSAAARQAEQAYNQTSGPATSGLPEASFLSLLNMLGVEAAMHLGLIKTPGEEGPPVDLEAARHLIDTLGMLETKTRGNLTDEEDKLLENILADLRMQFVAISRGR